MGIACILGLDLLKYTGTKLNFLDKSVTFEYLHEVELAVQIKNVVQLEDKLIG